MSATLPRSNSRSRNVSNNGSNRSNSNRRSSGSRSSGTWTGEVPNGLDFAGLQATIDVMEPTDSEYEDTCQIFLSSRFQLMGPFHRQYKDSQLITKDQWVEYWQTGVPQDKQIQRRVAAKMFDTCSFLGKGKSGITPTGIDNLQKQLPRKYRSVTSTGADRQLSRYSWYANGRQKRDISRASQILSPQKYEELIARLRAEAEAAKQEVARNQRSHEREIRQMEEKLNKARATVKRLKQELEAVRS